MTTAKKPTGLGRWLFNFVVVALALLASSFVVHVFHGNTIGFVSFLTGPSLAYFVVYCLLFALVYESVSGIWYPGTARKRVSLFFKDKSKARSLSIKTLEGIILGLGVTIVFLTIRYMIKGGLLGDTDADGVADTVDITTVVIIAVSVVALEAGGKTESNDDEDDLTGKEESKDDEEDKVGPKKITPGG